MRRALLALVVLFVAGAIAASAAFAGTYGIGACAVRRRWSTTLGSRSTTTPHIWKRARTAAAADISEGSPITSGLAAADVLKLSTNVPEGAMAGWQFIAPAGDTISAINIDRDLYRQAEGWLPQIVEADGSSLPGEACISNGGCEVSGEAMHTGLDTTSLAIELVCEPKPVDVTACGNGFSQHFARVELNSATVTVTDEQPPQVTSTSGELFTGGPVRGTITGTIEARTTAACSTPACTWMAHCPSNSSWRATSRGPRPARPARAISSA